MNSNSLSILNQELNIILNQGYKLIETNNGQSDNNGFISDGNVNYGTTWYFASP